MDREFAIVRDSWAKMGVKLTQRSYDPTTAFAEITKPKNQYLDFDLMMWDWVGYTDPDFVLSVVGCNQYGGWSDTGYCNKRYDALYKQQGVTLDRAKRKQIVWQMQKILYHDKPYVQLVQVDLIYGFRKGWTNIAPPYLNGLGKVPWINLAKS
jgi:peptide/nickel transport system substrate-binding protein